MVSFYLDYNPRVHCRIGSLENSIQAVLSSAYVHCRIGSLEKDKGRDTAKNAVHCRIGSLESI